MLKKEISHSRNNLHLTLSLLESFNFPSCPDYSRANKLRNCPDYSRANKLRNCPDIPKRINAAIVQIYSEKKTYIYLTYRINFKIVTRQRRAPCTTVYRSSQEQKVPKNMRIGKRLGVF